MDKKKIFMPGFPKSVLFGLLMLVLPLCGFAIGEFAGTYFGTFNGTGSGHFAMLVHANNTGVMSSYAQVDEEGVIISALPINTNGTFTFNLDGDTINGTLNKTGVSGTITGPSTTITFDGTKAPATGPLMDVGGYFSGTKLQGTVTCSGVPQGTISGTIDLIVSADGTAYMFGITYLENIFLGMEGGFFNVSANGTVSGTLLDNTQITGSVSLGEPGATGEMYFTDGTCTAQGTWDAPRVEGLPPLSTIPPLEVTFLASQWKATDFLTLEVPTRAIAFDSNNNLYIEDISDDGSGEIKILMLTASSGYKTSSSYALYETSYEGVTGLSFDDLGSLYVAERSVDGNAGIIREIDAVAQTLTRDIRASANHRPTGVGTDISGNIFYSGRRESAGTWGKIIKLDPKTDPVDRTDLIVGTVATGIAVDTSGNKYISTPQREDLPLLSNSIYRFAANDLLKPKLIATFDTTGEELTFDAAGNLYMLADDKVNIIKLSRISPRFMPWLPLLLE